MSYPRSFDACARHATLTAATYILHRRSIWNTWTTNPRKLEAAISAIRPRRYGYRFERLGEVFVERIIWAELPAPRRLAGVTVADAGYVWYRYWLLPEGQVVERYFTAEGVPIGTQIDLCAPIGVG